MQSVINYRQLIVLGQSSKSFQFERMNAQWLFFAALIYGAQLGKEIKLHCLIFHCLYIYKK